MPQPIRTDWPISAIGVEGSPVATARAIHWPTQNTLVSNRPEVIFSPLPEIERRTSAASTPITP